MFKGDESTVSVLEARLGGFSPAAWWASELARRRGVLQVGQDESTAEGEPSSSAKPEKARRAGKLHNPYEGVDYAWQLTETVDAFLSRLPPSTTPRLESKRPWIYICNPYIGGRRPRVESRAARLLRECGDEGPEEAGSSDLATFYQGGMERLHILSSFLDNARRSNTSAGKRLTSDAEMNRERASAVKDILELARMTGIKTGKVSPLPL